MGPEKSIGKKQPGKRKDEEAKKKDRSNSQEIMHENGYSRDPSSRSGALAGNASQLREITR
ncbi:hypothetical protein An02g14780 [Aspergillus niger]|uniref:Uncharacterized protein n=2 Tax=Aspergillus niger TaxID=5061 RepID=A2QFJ6_ASPNC|nr:hypothetical protein An02g14780 [Aspergillus niger]CAK48907.1 hypothetical protein An02g14780 [Aspergillus niger]